MRSITRLTLMVLFLCLLTFRVQAEDEQLRYHEPAPGAAIGAAFINVVAVPLRLVATLGVGILGGFTGFMLDGDRESAWDVWNLAGGNQVITSEMMQGRQGYRFTSFDPHP